MLRFYCDLTVDQAAEILGCSPGTVKSHTARALEAVRRTLGPAPAAGSGGQLPAAAAEHRIYPGGPGGSVLAAAAVAALAVGVGPVRSRPGPVTAGPAAPRQFNPLVPYASFGWLPAGESLDSGGITPTASYMDTGEWTLSVYARGQCHLTGSASVLNCPGAKLPIRQTPISKPTAAAGQQVGGGARGGGSHRLGALVLLDRPHVPVRVFKEAVA